MKRFRLAVVLLCVYSGTVTGLVVGPIAGTLWTGDERFPEAGFSGFLYGLWIGPVAGALAGVLLAWRMDRRFRGLCQ